MALSPAAAQQRRRLVNLVAAVAPAAGPESQQQIEEPGPQLLTLDRLKQFTRDGFIVLQLSDVPASVHQAIYDTAFAIEGEAAEGGGGGAAGRTWLRRGATDDEAEEEEGDTQSAGGGLGVSVAQTRLAAAARDGTAGWEQLAPAFRQLMDSAIVRGAATTICGEGFVASEPAAAPQPIGIVDRSLDQQWHKDMTAKGIREHCPRAISAWYYPCDTTLEMGPTAILPSSHLYGRDRIGCPHSEDRFDTDMGPAGKTLDSWKAGADQAIYLRGELDSREGRLHDGQALLGDPAIEARAMTVPAGSIVLKHDDIVHRRCRAESEGTKYRPMFGLGSFRRTREPEPGECLLAAAAVADGGAIAAASGSACCNSTEWSESDLSPGAPKAAVWECLTSWHLGHGCTLPASVRDSPLAPTTEELQRRLLTSASETERVGSAYTLAARGELACLADALAASESARRAACWGFGAAGPAAGMRYTCYAPLLRIA